MITAPNYTIVDKQNEQGWFWKTIHVFALNLIVLYRHNFGYRYLSPAGFYLGHWAVFAVISIIHYWITKTSFTIGVKCISLIFYCFQMAVALLSHWTSKTPPHRNSSGTSYLSYLLPNTDSSPPNGIMPAYWRVHVFAEPGLSALIGLIAFCFDRFLGVLWVVSSLALALKEVRNWHDYRDQAMITKEPGIGFPLEPRAGDYKPPAPQVHQKKSGNSNSSNLPGRTRIRDGQTDRVEQEYARLLAIPSGGIIDRQHLRTLWAESLKIHRSNRMLDDKKQADADLLKQKIDAAYRYFADRIARG